MNMRELHTIVKVKHIAYITNKREERKDCNEIVASSAFPARLLKDVSKVM